MLRRHDSLPAPIRLLFLGLLLLPASLPAQQTKPASAPAAHAGPPASYRIVINFRRNYKGKPRTEKTYTLLATVGETLPAIRDDAHFRTDPVAATRPAPSKAPPTSTFSHSSRMASW